jgi:hypothetical protein
MLATKGLRWAFDNRERDTRPPPPGEVFPEPWSLVLYAPNLASQNTV